jgi:hypothetical protein
MKPRDGPGQPNLRVRRTSFEGAYRPRRDSAEGRRRVCPEKAEDSYLTLERAATLAHPDPAGESATSLG